MTTVILLLLYKRSILIHQLFFPVYDIKSRLGDFTHTTACKVVYFGGASLAVTNLLNSCFHLNNIYAKKKSTRGGVIR